MKATFLSLFFICASALFAQQTNTDVKEVHIIFKTHLDIGYTDLQSKVEKTYLNEFIPKALDVADELKRSGAKERYVWTTGSWLIYTFLQNAPKPQVERLIKAIEAGDIVWNAMPYTLESETMNRELFETIMSLSNQLDDRFGKTTTGAKMTDVPGHTRSIVPLLAKAGVKMLHIGVNPGSYVPKVPPICRWRNTDGSEIVLVYQSNYGDDMVFPDGKAAMSVVFTGDNHGPHTVQQVKDIYARIQKKYPNATLKASSFTAVANLLDSQKEQFPVVTQEIGDTWVHGYQSAPVRMARFRAVQRLYTQWIKEGKINPLSEDALRFALRISFIPEHTWGLDIKTFTKHWDAYTFDAFNAVKNKSEFKHAELSWLEMDENVDRAIEFLPIQLQEEAKKALETIGTANTQHITGTQRPSDVNEKGEVRLKLKSAQIDMGKVTYQTYSADDFKRFNNTYNRDIKYWVTADFGKPGLENTDVKSATLEARVKKIDSKIENGKRAIASELAFPSDSKVDPRVLPEAVYSNTTIAPDGRSAEFSVTLYNKPANRLPEAYFVSFIPTEITKIWVEKLGQRIDVMDVVEGGNRQMHGVDNYVDIVTENGTIRITSLDAMLASIGECATLNFSLAQPDIKQGVHFNLFNNVWGTNFVMWWGGNMTYRFRVEIL